MQNGPIFIGGLDGSGKTYLRRALESHPDLSFSRRTYMWTHFYNRFGNLADGDNLQRCLVAMQKQKPIQELNPNISHIWSEFYQGPPTYARLFALFHQQFANSQGKRRWGDQLAYVERYADVIFSAYPDAKMIHMIRDPRQPQNPGKGKSIAPQGRAGWSAARWLQTARLAKRNSKRYPRSYQVVRFESLHQNPEATVRRVCDFIGEEYTAEMAAFIRSYPVEEGSTPAQKRGDQTLVGCRWRLFTQMVAGAYLDTFGYHPEPHQLSLAEKMIFYLVETPANLAGMLAWLAMYGNRERVVSN